MLALKKRKVFMYGQHIATRWLIKLKTNKKHHLEKSKLKTNKKREEENCGRLGAWLTDRDEMEIVKLDPLLLLIIHNFYCSL